MATLLKWASSDGSFKRQASQFRNFVSKQGPHQPEQGRYVLYISLACPWAHRTLIVRKLKGLEQCIGLSIVDYLMDAALGWKFSTAQETSGCIPDPIYNAKHLRELYFKADPDYSGRFTVPVLWDKKLETIVSNESADIIRMFNDQFDQFCTNPKLNLYPKELQSDIDSINEWIYEDLNNGVYRAGFATQQDKYEEAARIVLAALLKLNNDMFASKQYLVGEQLTEADVRLFTTIIRFDPVYFGHFKCNLLAIRDCPNILKWMKRIYPLVKDTVNMEHIKKHYYMSHKQINPNGIVPLSNGPQLE